MFLHALGDRQIKTVRAKKPKKSDKRPKAAVLVAAQLRRQIVTGRLKPGDKLQPESLLQLEFSVSRPTLREALRMLEAETLISIQRGKHGGARVTQIDLKAVAGQFGMYLQTEGTTLADVWLARTMIEPPAAALLAASRDPAALAALEANIAAARVASKSDLVRYGELTAEFSGLITQFCGNKTIHLLASLIYDIIRRQHKDVTARTVLDARVDKLRQENIRNREKAVGLIRSGKANETEAFWRAHLERMRDLVLAAYKGPATLDLLNEPAGRRRSLANVRREAAPVDAEPT